MGDNHLFLLKLVANDLSIVANVLYQNCIPLTLRNDCANTRFLSQISTFLLFLGNLGRVHVPLSSNRLIF